MRKLFCLLLSLVLLLSLAACNKEQETDRECIEEMLVCRHKSMLGLATMEEFRSSCSEAFWEKSASAGISIEQQYEKSLAKYDQETGKLLSESLADMFGENFTITAEITEMEPVEDIEQREETLYKSYHYALDVEKAYHVKTTIRYTGDKDTTEMEQEDWVCLVDGRWCVR